MTESIKLLLDALKTASQTDRVDILNELAFAYANVDLAQMKSYCLEAQTLARQLNYQKGLGRSYNNLAIYSGIQGQYSAAKEYAFQALHIYQAIEDQMGMAKSYNNLGLIFKKQLYWGRALDYLHKALRIYETLQDQKCIADVALNIGTLYLIQHDPQQAIDHFHQALEKYNILDNPHQIAMALSNIGKAHITLENWDAALEYHQQAFRYQQEVQNPRGIADTQAAFGFILMKKRDFDTALTYAHQAASFYEEAGLQNALTLANTLLATIYLEKGDIETAENWGQRALENTQTIESIEPLAKVYYTLQAIYHAKGDYKQAYHFLNQLRMQEREISTQERTQQIAEIRVKYETELKEHELEIYKLKNVKLAETINQINTLNRLLVKKDSEKTEVLNIVAHDLRNPLTTILLDADLIHHLVQEEPPNRKHIQQKTQTIIEAAQQMITIIDNLLNTDAIEMGTITISPSKINLDSFLKKKIAQYHSIAINKGIELKYTPTVAPIYLQADSNLLSEVIDNLVSNALKYSYPGTTVTIQTVGEEAHCRIQIQDQGQGLTKDDLSKLFRKFQKLSAKPTAGEHSTGLGLSIVKKLVEAMNGKVWAESEGKNKGSTFIVELPLAT
ncbi:MAG: hypothetical protein D6675_02470 [Gemmatimonadetes bacterium]|nr:MAG: hypothetical protein D6675_02470 [Gemmatimonadota bacterium]